MFYAKSPECHSHLRVHGQAHDPRGQGTEGLTGHITILKYMRYQIDLRHTVRSRSVVGSQQGKDHPP